ncbi:succinoglycan biosynthesis protein exoi [Pararhizobium sp. LjRoot255]|uniref:sunset domain-containing protein n=1 Tax=Pararhizobium sp. LjRoot255 TaxID=3342298 RepID=UPI003ECE18BA
MRRHQFYRKPQRRSLLASMAAAPGIALGLVAFGAAGIMSAEDLLSSLSQTAKDCNIKGNISISTGERIFHVPGQEYYSATNISPQYGERWFCSEAEAWAAGWRKARN